MIEVENPYGEAGEFKITILESNNRYGVIKNPYNKNVITGSSIDEMMSKQSTSSLNNESQLKQQSKSTVESNSNNNNSNSKFSFKSNSRTKANKSPTKRVKINETSTSDKHNGEFRFNLNYNFIEKVILF
jgi:hypothetical protein